MRRNNEPVGHTCPMIDEIISAIESVDWDDTYWTKNDLIDTMEKIRTANGTLRDWGNEKCKECEELEKEIEYLQKDIKSHESTIEDLKGDINDLSFDISRLEEEIELLQNQD